MGFHCLHLDNPQLRSQLRPSEWLDIGLDCTQETFLNICGCDMCLPIYTSFHSTEACDTEQTNLVAP